MLGEAGELSPNAHLEGDLVAACAVGIFRIRNGHFPNVVSRFQSIF